MPAATPYPDANPFERSAFRDEWGVLGNDVFFGGARSLFGLSPASRTLLLLSESSSKASRSNAHVTDPRREDFANFASATGWTFAFPPRGRFAPNAITAVKQFDGGTAADPAIGTSQAWGTSTAWSLDGIPTGSDDVVFDNVFRSTLQNVQLGGTTRAANSITLSLTTNQTWGLGATASSSNATLAITTGNITRNSTTNNSLNTVGAVGGTGIGMGVMTLTTGATGFTITNLDANGQLQINAVISGSTKTVTTVGPGTTLFSGANTYSGPTTVSSGTLLIAGDNSAATGAVSVTNLGTLLGGTGTIGGAVTVDGGGAITGGTNGSIGTLTLNSNLTFSATSGTPGTFLIDLSGVASDVLALGGVLNLSGFFDQLALAGTPDGSSSYTLATYSSVSGTFDVDNIPMNYHLIYGTNDLILAPIPEPSTWIGAALALAAIGFTQRRRLRGLVPRGT
jgi:autotransporter-associated beta strand protein